MPNDTRRSPVRALIDNAGIDPAEQGLYDRSDTGKVGLKGPGVVDWLTRQALSCPQNIYALTRLDNGSLLVRIASDEVIIESPQPDGLIQRIENALLDGPTGVFRVEQQSATFILDGPSAPAIWAQTCGVNIVEEPDDRIVYTRVAGISCGVIPETCDTARAYRIWVDYSYGSALWQTLTEICAGLTN